MAEARSRRRGTTRPTPFPPPATAPGTTPNTSGAALLRPEERGCISARLAKPAGAALGERLAALDAGVGAVCTARGQAGLHLAIATLMGTGSHIAAAASLYGGSINMLKLPPPRF